MLTVISPAAVNLSFEFVVFSWLVTAFEFILAGCNFIIHILEEFIDFIKLSYRPPRVFRGEHEINAGRGEFAY